jgi:XTP/dITP diphosphohydrolase
MADRPASPSPDAALRSELSLRSSYLTIVLATSNQGKLRELQQLLHGLPVSLVSATDALGGPLEVVEDGETFEANALKKARAFCQATGMVALADDSGLEVDALGGKPGVYSARFAHPNATDEENNLALLEQLSSYWRHAPTARFRCVLAMVSPWDERYWMSEGACPGTITESPRGSGGFGYDPLFVADELGGSTLAEVTAEEKNRVSHRSRAAAAMIPHLVELVNLRLEEVDRVVDERSSWAS